MLFRSSLPLWSWQHWMTSKNDKQELVCTCNQPKLEDQTEVMAGQDQIACRVDSALSLQPGQRSSRTIFRFFKFSRDGSELVPALHSRVLTRLGTHKPQTPFHMLLVDDKSEVDGTSNLSSSISLLYPDLTEYNPSGLCG